MINKTWVGNVRPPLDTTLTKAGMAADAKAVGDALSSVSTLLQVITENDDDTTGLTLGVHTDGLVYLFVNGVPQGNGLDIKADVVEGDVFGYVDENNNIVLDGALADGTYTVKYKMEDGSVVDIGELELGEIEAEETNYFNASTASLNYRIGSSGSISSYNGMVTTDYIPWEDAMSGKKFKISGLEPCLSTQYNYYGRVVYYDAKKTKIAEQNPTNDTFYRNGITTVYDTYSGGGFVRISLVVKDNAEITAGDIANLKITLA